MNKQETAKMFFTMKGFWPKYFSTLSQEDMQNSIDAWTALYKAEPFKTVFDALLAYVRSADNGFPPSPGQLNAIIDRQENSGTMTAEEAWGYVQKALQRSGYEYENEFNKLPYLCQRIVGTPTTLRAWALEDIVSLEQFERRRFMDRFREIKETEHMARLGGYEESVQKIETPKENVIALIKEHQKKEQAEQ